MLSIDFRSLQLQRWRSLLAATVLLALLASLTPIFVSAHETRTVAEDYEFVVGFINEPAIANDTNGVWVRVTKGDEPVEGLAGTLQAEVLYEDQSMEATLRPSFNEAGVFTSPFIPTAAGDYTFRFFGQIEGIDVDESFTSSPEGFDSVKPRSDYEFPASEEGSATRSVAMPAAVGSALLVMGAFGFAVRRRSAA